VTAISDISKQTIKNQLRVGGSPLSRGVRGVLAIAMADFFEY